MKKYIALFLCLILFVPLSADYSSLTTEERAAVRYAFEKAMVYNDLIAGDYTVKIKKATVTIREQVDADTAWWLVKITFVKIMKGSKEEIETTIEIPLKITAKAGSRSVLKTVFALVGAAGIGFLGGFLLNR